MAGTLPLQGRRGVEGALPKHPCLRKKEAAAIHEELESEAALAALGPALVLGEDGTRLDTFLPRSIDSLLGSGSIQQTTAAAYRRCTAHICRYLSA